MARKGPNPEQAIAFAEWRPADGLFARFADGGECVVPVADVLDGKPSLPMPVTIARRSYTT